MARTRARARYYANAYYVRRRRRQAVAQWLSLSTELGATNRPDGGGGAGLPPPTIDQVYLVPPVSEIKEAIVYGSQIRYHPVIKMFDVDRSYFAIDGSDIRLTAR